jgi:hypothetical protein
MTQQSKTPWFKSAEHDPVRPGVYLVKRTDGELWWREKIGSQEFWQNPRQWAYHLPTTMK